jgi:hypothetical protein
MCENQELHDLIIAQIAHEVSKISIEDILNRQFTSRTDPNAKKALKG